VFQHGHAAQDELVFVDQDLGGFHEIHDTTGAIGSL
jgi:hypothetical protein